MFYIPRFLKQLVTASSLRVLRTAEFGELWPLVTARWFQRGYNSIVVLIRAVHIDFGILGDQRCDARILSLCHLPCLQVYSTGNKNLSIVIIQKIVTNVNSCMFQECTGRMHYLSFFKPTDVYLYILSILYVFVYIGSHTW